MQVSFNKRVSKRGRRASRPATCLTELRAGEQGVLDRLDLPEDISRRLMELGFLPGSPVVAARSAPGGDPRVFRVDGAEIALRHETAVHLILRDELPQNRAGS
jgi:ferrous iron transport protein A